MKVNYQAIPYLIASQRDFKGNSCKGIKEEDKYKVYSYQTLIYEADLNGVTLFFDNRYFSQTTSKLQNIICDILNLKQKRDN